MVKILTQHGVYPRLTLWDIPFATIKLIYHCKFNLKTGIVNFTTQACEDRNEWLIECKSIMMNTCLYFEFSNLVWKRILLWIKQDLYMVWFDLVSVIAVTEQVSFLHIEFLRHMQFKGVGSVIFRMKKIEIYRRPATLGSDLIYTILVWTCSL